MQREWNERAVIDPYHYVLNRKGLGEWSTAEFLATGEENCVRFLDPFCTEFNISTHQRIALEIGCGAGRESWALAKRFRRVIGLDVSSAMIDLARQNTEATNVDFRVGNGVNLDVVETDSVSFVYSAIVFQHIPDVTVQYDYLREVGRVLKPGGWFFIHLYADEKDYADKLRRWQIRAEAGDLMGWSEAALPELQDERFLTSMQTPVNYALTLAVLEEAGLELKHDVDANTFAWRIGGQKK
jgi:SAM-dependent methyltransferase